LKTRIVTWTIVGILVLIGVVVIASGPRAPRGPKVTLDMAKGEAVKAEAQIDRLVARIAEARKAVAPGATPDKSLEEADRLLAQAREKLGQVKQATELKQAESQLIEGKRMLREARRAVELATKAASRPHGL
jgi:hypothetical protein